MNRNPSFLYADLVSNAIFDKYGNSDAANITPLVGATIQAVDGASHATLLDRLRPISDLADDVQNEVVVLTLIDRFWSSPPGLPQPLMILHRHCLGLAENAVFRLRENVADFGGDAPTTATEIAARF